MLGVALDRGVVRKPIGQWVRSPWGRFALPERERLCGSKGRYRKPGRLPPGIHTRSCWKACLKLLTGVSNFRLWLRVSIRAVAAIDIGCCMDVGSGLLEWSYGSSPGGV